MNCFAISLAPGFSQTPFGYSDAESQRDSGLQPRVARNELPWENRPQINNPNEVAAGRARCDATPLGLKSTLAATQGSSFLATLGWRPQPRWGCSGLKPNAKKIGTQIRRLRSVPVGFSSMSDCGRSSFTF